MIIQFIKHLGRLGKGGRQNRPGGAKAPRFPGALQAEVEVEADVEVEVEVEVAPGRRYTLSVNRCTRHDLARGPDGLCARCLKDKERLSAPRNDRLRIAARLLLALLAFIATFAALLSYCDTN